jgi:hypothetical protein
MRRPLIIIVVTLVAAVVGFYFLAEHIRYALAERPYVAALRTELRRVADAQATYRASNAAYASVLSLLPPNSDSIKARGIRVTILAASAEGFLAEGDHVSWAGRCVIAVGSYAGDSLKAGEPHCYSS